MDRYRELLSIITEIIENTTNVSVNELEDRAYTYYNDGDISPTQYDHIIGLTEELY